MEFHFSIPLTGVVSSNGNTVTITVNRAETNMDLPFEFLASLAKNKPGPGMSLADIVLESALILTNRDGIREFTAADLLHKAEESHDYINKRSFWSRVIASAPNHSSAKHFQSQHRYLRYIGGGKYMLEPKNIIMGEPNFNPGDIDESLWVSAHGE